MGCLFLSFLERILRIDIDNPPKPSFEKEGFVMSEIR